MAAKGGRDDGDGRSPSTRSASHKVQVDIDEERAKIEEFLEAAYEAPGSGNRRALANANTDPWSVAKDVNDRWQTLRSERSTLDVVKRAAQAKKELSSIARNRQRG